MDTTDATSPTLSIGDLAQATGLTVEAIRMWERRYGRPASHRLPSGHRRYTQEQLLWLRRVAEALAHGARAAEAVLASDAALQALLPSAAQHQAPEVDGWLDAVRTFDAATLRARLRRELAARSPESFVDEVVAPLLAAVGRAWADGRLDIRHEHHLSSLLAEELGAARDQLPAPPGAPCVLFATLPDERHSMGIEMAAFVAASAGACTVVVGADTPVAEIAAAAREVRASAVAVSVSSGNGGVAAERALAELRAILPPAVRVLVGGAGARRRRRRARAIERIDDFRRFAEVVRSLRDGTAR